VSGIASPFECSSLNVTDARCLPAERAFAVGVAATPWLAGCVDACEQAFGGPAELMELVGAERIDHQ
jgi:hypothetical protein